MKIQIATPFLIFLLTFSLMCESNESKKHFRGMEFFDRELILEHKIAAIEVIISKSKIKKFTPKALDTCIVYRNHFDSRGNLIKEGLRRVSTKFYYKYNETDQLIDWGWDKEPTKEKTSLVTTKPTKKERDESLQEQTTKIHDIMNYKIDPEKIVDRKVSDICFLIDANYRFTHTLKNGLPDSALAKKLSDVKSDFLKKEFKSPENLFIYYRYEFFR